MSFVLFDEWDVETLTSLEESAAPLKEAAALSGKLARAVNEYGMNLKLAYALYSSPSLKRSAEKYLKWSQACEARHAELEQTYRALPSIVALVREDYDRIEQWVRAGYAAKWEKPPAPPKQSAAVVKAVATVVQALAYAGLLSQRDEIHDPREELGTLEDSPFLRRLDKVQAEMLSLSEDLGMVAHELEADFVPKFTAEWAQTIEAKTDWGAEDFAFEDDEDEDGDEEPEE